MKSQMRFIIITTLLATFIFGLIGCALYPNLAEQKKRLSKENFSEDYRVAVTTYQRDADIDAAVMQTTIGTLLRQGSVNEALSRITRLEKIDAAMQDAAHRLLPARADILDRASYGATAPIAGGEIVADDAMRVALEKGHDALLFVAVQPVLTTSGITGFETFRIQLLGLTQLHKVVPSGGIGGNTALLHGMDTVNCAQPAGSDGTQPLQDAIDNCIDDLALQLKKSFEVRLETLSP